jgi:molybdopterin converting factor subunit 1
MKVRLLLFAQYRDLAGTNQVDMELPPGATAAEAVSRLRAQAFLEQLPGAPAVAVNQEFAPLSIVLQDGDEIALIPPVAGG